METTQNKPKKTYARELACVLLLSMLYFGYKGEVELVEALVWPFISFAVAAFGFKTEVVKEAVAGRNLRK